jgi:TM2 domain-containing membrane protein YozV
MIRLKTSILLLFVLTSVYAQQAYDFEHTLKFGQYLYNTTQYNLASQEFERAVYYKPSDSLSNILLFKTYTILNQKDKALASYIAYTNDSALRLMPDYYGTPYIKLLIKNEEYSDCLGFLERNCCVSNRNTYYVTTMLAQKNWESAWEYASKLKGNEPNISPLLNLVEKSRNTRYKKPFVGALFSAIIPGTGKVYAGAWQDGIIGFFMTSISGFLAYRAYDKYGIENPYTWFVGGMALGYYTGNVYGGQSAVKKYNLKKENEIVDETKRYISDL